MEALVPAFIAALLAQAGDRSPWLVAILADRYGRPVLVAVAALFAHALGNAIAGAAGAIMAPIMTPNARQLLLALAFIFAGMGALSRLKPPDRLDGWRLGALPVAFTGVFILALGDTTQFFTLAFAARGPSPWLAVAGATIAAFAISLVAALMGEEGWLRLPIRGFRIGFGVACFAAGGITAVAALRLI